MRLLIIISGKGVSQVFEVGELPSARGHAIYIALNERDISDKVIGLSFDTTNHASALTERR